MEMKFLDWLPGYVVNLLLCGWNDCRDLTLTYPVPQGAYAEFIAVSECHILRKPEHLSWIEAASIPENFLTGQYRYRNI